MTKISVDRAQNAMQQRVSKHELTQKLVAHALNVSSNSPVYSDEDCELLGHWQDVEWIERLRGLAKDLAGMEREVWMQAAEELF